MLDIPYLRELALNNNPLQRIEGHAFEMVPQIVALDVSGRVKLVKYFHFDSDCVEGCQRGKNVRVLIRRGYRGVQGVRRVQEILARGCAIK